MYRVAIVDDDIVVLSFLEKMIDWEAYGFTLTHVFRDSLKAAEQLLEDQVDLVITDIGMPRMNGIELIRYLRESGRPVQSVILSCHDEFHFAQQALKLGTLDYMLKETMEIDSVEELLNRVKERLDEEQLRSASFLQEEAIAYFQQEPEQDRWFACVFTEEKASWVQVPVLQGEMPKKSRLYVYEEAYFLEIEKSEAVGFLNSWARPHTVLYSDNRAKLLAHKEQRFYLPKGACAAVVDVPFQETDWFSSYDHGYQKAEHALFQESEEALCEWTENTFCRLIDKQPHPDIARSWAVKLLVDLEMKVRSLYGTTGKTARVDPDVKQAPTVLALKGALLAALEELRCCVKSRLDAPLHSEITKAQKYVRLHIDQKIGLQEVADHLHLNASYFSRLYKQQTGETFIAYVTKEKMNRAKELLDQTERTVEEIADLLGYEHKSYFVKTFKKQYGIPPKEYRSRLIVD